MPILDPFRLDGRRASVTDGTRCPGFHIGHALSDAQSKLESEGHTIAADWASSGVTVNAIAPGSFLTDANRRWIGEKPEFEGEVASSIPMGRWGDPKEIGGLAVYLASDASSYMTGQVLVLDGGRLLW